MVPACLVDWSYCTLSIEVKSFFRAMVDCNDIQYSLKQRQTKRGLISRRPWHRCFGKDYCWVWIRATNHIFCALIRPEQTVTERYKTACGHDSFLNESIILNHEYSVVLFELNASQTATPPSTLNTTLKAGHSPIHRRITVTLEQRDKTVFKYYVQ